VQFGDGATTATLSIDLINDEQYEYDDETFTLQIVNVEMNGGFLYDHANLMLENDLIIQDNEGMVITIKDEHDRSPPGYYCGSGQEYFLLTERSNNGGGPPEVCMGRPAPPKKISSEGGTITLKWVLGEDDKLKFDYGGPTTDTVSYKVSNVLIYMTDSKNDVDCTSSSTTVDTSGVGLDCVPKLDVLGRWRYVGDFPGEDANNIKIDHLPGLVMYQINEATVVSNRMPLTATELNTADGDKEAFYYFFAKVVVSEEQGEANKMESRPSYVLAASTGLRSLPSVAMWANDHCMWNGALWMPQLVNNGKSIQYLQQGSSVVSWDTDREWPVVADYVAKSDPHIPAAWQDQPCGAKSFDLQCTGIDDNENSDCANRFGVTYATGGRLDVAWEPPMNDGGVGIHYYELYLLKRDTTNSKNSAEIPTEAEEKTAFYQECWRIPNYYRSEGHNRGRALYFNPYRVQSCSEAEAEPWDTKNGWGVPYNPEIVDETNWWLDGENCKYKEKCHEGGLELDCAGDKNDQICSLNGQLDPTTLVDTSEIGKSKFSDLFIFSLGGLRNEHKYSFGVSWNLCIFVILSFCRFC
jgi:hypothetical protein